MNKEQKRITPVFFFDFAREIFKERELALKHISNGKTVDAVAALEYMEVILADYMVMVKDVQRQDWQTIDNCVKELLANDIPSEVQLTQNQSQRFVKGATETLKKLFE